jgi:energy-coupling factor transporter ATP-binding protein EcfA2
MPDNREMSIQEKIFEWVQGLDGWKQELFLRASSAPELSDEDLKEVTSMLLGEEMEGGGPRAVTREDLPGAQRGEEPMAVHSLSDLHNVNAIANGQALEFEPEGLNVVYGKNGAGKTGYSRILKRAGRTLYRETVLTNVAGGDGLGPSATITVSVGDDIDPVQLDLEQPAPAHLGRICIADEQACEVYLTTDIEVNYAPVMLTNLRRLRDGLEKVDTELGRRRIEAEPGELDLTPYAADTEVRALLESLPTATSKAVEALATLSEEELAKREELRRKLGEIEAAQAPKLRKAAEDDAAAADRLAKELDQLAAAFGEEMVWEAKERLAKVEELRRAADLAAEGFEGEPLGGVGSDPWRALWKAARAYSAHLREGLPEDHVFEHCPLCMQELGQEARGRLGRFDRFVRSEINVQLEVAVRADEEARKALPDPAVSRSRHEDTLARLGLEDGETGAEVVAWFEAALVASTRLRATELDGLAGVLAPPGAVREWAAARRKDAEGHAALEKADDQVALRLELEQLDARHVLGEHRDAVLAHLTAEAEARRINEARKELGKTDVSNKMTQLSREVIQEDLQAALNRQLDALGFFGLKVEAKAKTPKGTPKVELCLKTVDRVPLTDVLSKGEQRRLSLAMFLAEMEVVSDPSPIVLDDPVTSVDQEGRGHIARTLVKLAEKRQIIVFTHELSFVHELQRAARSDLPLRIQQVRRIDRTVGHVSDDLPWTGLKAKQRFEWLKPKLDAARDLYEEYDEEKYRPTVSEFCMLLRQSFERAIEEEVFANVITRRSDTVHTTALDNVVIDDQICELADRGTAENSPWVHDQPLADGADPPTPDELEEGLEIYKDLLAAVKERRKTRNGATKSEPKLAVIEPPSPSESDDKGAALRGV